MACKFRVLYFFVIEPVMS